LITPLDPPDRARGRNGAREWTLSKKSKRTTYREAISSAENLEKSPRLGLVDGSAKVGVPSEEKDELYGAGGERTKERGKLEE
jgi:hypothetical protein